MYPIVRSEDNKGCEFGTKLGASQRGFEQVPGLVFAMFIPKYNNYRYVR